MTIGLQSPVALIRLNSPRIFPIMLSRSPFALASVHRARKQSNGAFGHVRELLAFVQSATRG